ncbi:MAG: hypothetical protein SGI99_01430 [Pseudomonadota bacterium]|nr:hypothetical protein [Pseudomonadota bacterium]
MSGAERVLRYAALDPHLLRRLLNSYELELIEVGERAPIPGCFWGLPEAGVIADQVYVRADTPVHSLLHEACHLILLPRAIRQRVHTDASDCQLEEDATCLLQLVLSDRIVGFGLDRACVDMDAWGYSFRLGSARAWFDHDAEDARQFLIDRGLLSADSSPIPALRLATATGAV